MGLEFQQGANRVDPAKLATHLAQLKYLQFIKMPNSTAAETEKWSQRLPDKYSVLHCAAGGR